MHGNVGEWVWDYYGEYALSEQTDPTGAESGTLRVYRGGGWNDFAKNMRSAYRATLAADKGMVQYWHTPCTKRRGGFRKRHRFTADKRFERRQGADCVFLLGRQHKRHCGGNTKANRSRPL
jgi:hypothetical protein